MNRPDNYVKLLDEDQKSLTTVGDFWAAQALPSLWREEDGSLWADPVEYAKWSQADVDGEVKP